MIDLSMVAERRMGVTGIYPDFLTPMSMDVRPFFDCTNESGHSFVLAILHHLYTLLVNQLYNM